MLITIIEIIVVMLLIVISTILGKVRYKDGYEQGAFNAIEKILRFLNSNRFGKEPYIDSIIREIQKYRDDFEK